MVATRDIQMVVLPRPASKRPRAPLTCRFMCIRCGQVVSSTPEKLAEDMEPHFTDKLRFGCPQVDSRRPNVSIAFFDHGLDDALFHCQRELRHAQRQMSDQASTQRLAHAQRAGRKADRAAQGGENDRAHEEPTRYNAKQSGLFPEMVRFFVSKRGNEGGHSTGAQRQQLEPRP